MTEDRTLADSPHWHSVHVYLHTGTEDTDAFLTEDLAPLMSGLMKNSVSGRPASWFFIRYHDADGPHLRVRTRGLDAEAARTLTAELGRLAAGRPPVEGPWASRHGEVREVPYVPETARYGGPLALPVAEETFAVSSRVALQALQEMSGGESRLNTAVDIAHSTAAALGLPPLAASRWLRRHAAGWRWVTEVRLLPGALVHSKVNSVYARQRATLARRAEKLHEDLEQGTAAPWLTGWADHVRSADRGLRATDGAGPDGAGPDGAAPLLQVWGSQLHMLLNRLGVTPDEERAVCRLAARTLMDTGGPSSRSFFPAEHTAPDRRYLERSKFQIGRNEDSAVRSAVLPPSYDDRGAAPGEIALPGGDLPEISLRAALTTRASVRGAFHGPLTAAELGTLLGNAYAETHHSEKRLADGSAYRLSHRPYPSAGALYTVRLRLLALDVDGLPAGTYDCVPRRRAVRAIGPAPTVEQIKPLSSYFALPPDDPTWIGVERAPAVLALYLDLGTLRRRYGLRALRLGLLEAGHLAQTLVLVAGALGLATTTLGAVNDDLAHELLGLDDLDEPVQYLLPLGRRPPASPEG